MKKWTYLLTIIFVGTLIGIALYLGDGTGGNNLNFYDNSGGNTARQSNVPHYVIDVLEEVRETGKAPSGYVGGRTFYNREKLLPKKEDDGKKIKYREWDVHPKVKGKNRGAERLVTGSDDNAYYTKDHYRSFTKIIE